MNIGDIIRVICAFQNADGSALYNVFTFLLTAVGSGTASDLLDDIEAWADNFYSDWMSNVSSSIVSDFLQVQKRDTTAGEWNTVGEATWTTSDGTVVSDTPPPGVSALLVGYPGQPRHRGRKFLPPPTEIQTTNGAFDTALAADFALTLARYLVPMSETNYSANPGVFEESTETFRGFAGSGTFSLIPAYQRRRKQAVGI